MLFEPFSLALLGAGLISLYLVLVASFTAVQVIRYWDLEADDNRQIELEQRTWLSSALVQGALVLQMVSLVIMIGAADHFADLLSGAMCATGALTANSFGVPALMVKIVTLFCAAIWLTINQIDLSVPTYPLTTAKHWLILALLPLICLDLGLVTAYLALLRPDIVVSCCGVIFAESTPNGFSLIGLLPTLPLLGCYGALVGVLIWLAIFMRLKMANGKTIGGAEALVAGLGWPLFYLLSVVVITVIVSPYVYAMPHHRCPFDLLRGSYTWIGYPLYLSLHGAVIAGITIPVTWWAARYAGAADTAQRIQRRAVPGAMALLLVFLTIAAFKPLMYNILGGQW
jgi:hypothetical protein